MNEELKDILTDILDILQRINMENSCDMAINNYIKDVYSRIEQLEKEV